MDKQMLKENCCKLVNIDFLTPLEERPVALKPDFYLHALGRSSPIDFKALEEKKLPPSEGENEKTTNVVVTDGLNKPLTSIEFDEEKFIMEEEIKRRNKLNNIKGILKK